jgi:hypothetical protein
MKKRKYTIRNGALSFDVDGIDGETRANIVLEGNAANVCTLANG